MLTRGLSILLLLASGTLAAPRWLNNLDDGLRAAFDTGRPIFVHVRDNV